MRTIEAVTVGGLDWHDIKKMEEYLTVNGGYNIPEEKTVETIYKDIVAAYDVPIPFTAACVMYVYNNKEASCKFQDDIEGTGYQLYWRVVDEDTYEKVLVFNCWYGGGQVDYKTIYHIGDIPDEEVVYMVVENFLCPAKGVPSVQRMYREPFTDLTEAREYMESLPIAGKDKSMYGSRKELIVTSLGLINQKWLEEQRKANALMKKCGQSNQSDDFCIFTEADIERLKNNGLSNELF